MTFLIERGGASPPFRGSTMKARVTRERTQREMHGLAIDVQGDRTVKELAAEVANQRRVMLWWNDLRKGHLNAYGSLLRFIDISVALGVKRDVLLRIPAWLHFYIRDQYPDTDTGEFPAMALERRNAS